MTLSPSGRIDIVPQGEFHFEVRFFAGESDKRYRSWSLPLAAAEVITRWWLRRSLPLGEAPLDSEESARLEVRADETCSISLKRVAGKSDIRELHKNEDPARGCDSGANRQSASPDKAPGCLIRPLPSLAR